jgi:hypothetical protein
VVFARVGQTTAQTPPLTKLLDVTLTRRNEIIEATIPSCGFAQATLLNRKNRLQVIGKSLDDVHGRDHRY